MKENKIYRIVCILYIIGSGLVSLYHALSHNGILVMMGPLSCLFLLIPPVGEWLLRLKLGEPLRCWVLIFCFIGFTLGTGMRWHDNLPHYDDISHFLSGILFTVLGLCLYGRIRQDRPVDRTRDVNLQITYSFFFSMFVAVIWEIGEYLAYLITGHDAQHTLTTGVHDTMQDIIACFLGSLIVAADYFISRRKGLRSPVVRLADGFDNANRE